MASGRRAATHRRWYGTQMLAGPPGNSRPQKLANGTTVSFGV
jgi:hypothetical protein